jgi:hypothetical protein
MSGLRWVVIVLVAAVVTTGCGKGPQVTEADCRQAFADHAQLLGENGNPGSDLTPRLTARWDDMDAELGRLATTATSDTCPSTLDRYKLESKRLEKLLYAVADFDVAQDLVIAESGLEHARRTQPGFKLDHDLREAFATLRTDVPKARQALAPEFAKVDAVDPLDTAATKTALDHLKSVAEANPAYRKVKAASDVIGGYELDEE